MTTKVSVIIVSWNSADTIRQCLTSVLREKGVVAEVIMVDNASTDGTSAIVRNQFPQVRLIQNKENAGLAKALNQGIKEAGGSYISMINPDTRLGVDALGGMVEFAQSDPKIGIVGPKLLSSGGGLQREVQRFPTLWPMVLWLFRLHRILPFPHLPPLRGFLLQSFDYGKTQEAEHLMGATLLLRRRMLDEIGLFDENFWLWFEETDLEKRAKDAGWKVVYYPKVKVSHLVGESTRQVAPFRLQSIWNRSLRYYFKKHRPLWEQVVLEPFLWLSFVPVPLFIFGKALFKRRGGGPVFGKIGKQ